LRAPNIIDGVNRFFSYRLLSFSLRLNPCVTRNVEFLLEYPSTELIVISFELLLHPEEHPPSKIFLPIITTTTHALRDDREKCPTSCMNDCISQPVSPQKPVCRLKKWLPKIMADGTAIAVRFTFVLQYKKDRP
jgi:hypothetical protein